jgi:hypothetical protein
LSNCWRPIFLVLPKLDGCQVDLPNGWSCSQVPNRVLKIATVAVFKFNETGSVNRPNRPVSRKAQFCRYD